MVLLTTPAVCHAQSRDAARFSETEPPGGVYSGKTAGVVGAFGNGRVAVIPLPVMWFYTGSYRAGWPGLSGQLALSPLALAGIFFGDLGANFAVELTPRSLLAFEAGVDALAALPDGVESAYLGPYVGISVLNSRRDGPGLITRFTFRMHLVDTGAGGPVLFSVGIGVGRRR
jgi:hypothetical protein